MSNLYAVIGSPIDHSLSPIIHTAFAKQLGVELSYEKIEVKPGDFTQQVIALQKKGYQGLNVTVPLKTLAYEFCEISNDMAQRAGAVNTIAFSKTKTSGFNTDGIGLLRDLQENHQITLDNKKILLLGAGGAVRGAILPLLEAKPELLTIANRTPEKASALVQLFNDYSNILACNLQDLVNQQYDIIINGTSAGLNNSIPTIPATCLAPNGVSYDMLYGKQPTAFVRWGKKYGAKLALDGLGMLVEQAAEAFRIWHGAKPKTQDIIQQLRTL